jgi:hypothetical protein
MINFCVLFITADHLMWHSINLTCEPPIPSRIQYIGLASMKKVGNITMVLGLCPHYIQGMGAFQAGAIFICTMN